MDVVRRSRAMFDIKFECLPNPWLWTSFEGTKYIFLDFQNCECRNIRILVLACDIEMRSTLSKQKTFKKSGQFEYIFYEFNSYNFRVILQQSKNWFWLIFYSPAVFDENPDGIRLWHHLVAQRFMPPLLFPSLRFIAECSHFWELQGVRGHENVDVGNLGCKCMQDLTCSRMFVPVHIH